MSELEPLELFESSDVEVKLLQGSPPLPDDSPTHIEFPSPLTNTSWKQNKNR
jgi:hypothetical protein